MGVLKDIALYGIPAYVALIISAIILVQERLRYYIKLRLIISYVRVGWNKENQSLVLFRMAFVNHALRGQIVESIVMIPPQDITYQTFVYQCPEDSERAFCPDADGQYSYSLPANEVLRDALDIPAQQSRSAWYGVLLNWWQVPPILEDVLFPIWFYAHDIDGKELAKYGIVMTLKQLRNPKMYKVPKSVRMKK